MKGVYSVLSALLFSLTFVFTSHAGTLKVGCKVIQGADEGQHYIAEIKIDKNTAWVTYNGQVLYHRFSEEKSNVPLGDFMYFGAHGQVMVFANQHNRARIMYEGNPNGRGIVECILDTSEENVGLVSEWSKPK